MNETKKAKHISIYKSPVMDRLLAMHPDASVSGLLSDVCERFLHIIKSTAIPLSEADIQRIKNALRNLQIDVLTVEYLHDELARYPETSDLASQVKAFSTAEKYALLEKINH